MTTFIQNLIGNDYISSVILSLIPLIELKGGIVFARGVGFSFFEALGLCYLGSTIVFIPVFFLLRPILDLLKRIKWFNKFALKVEGFFSKKAEKAVKNQEVGSGKKPKSEKFYKMLGVFIFVAIPLPMTGVWTGTAIAVFLNLKFKDAILPIVIGNLIAGVLISLLAELCKAIWTIKSLDYILWGLFALAVILLVITVIRLAKVKPKETDQDKADK